MFLLRLDAGENGIRASPSEESKRAFGGRINAPQDGWISVSFVLPRMLEKVPMSKAQSELQNFERKKNYY